MACESYREFFSFSIFKTIHFYTNLHHGDRQYVVFVSDFFSKVLRFLGRSFLKDYEFVNAFSGFEVVNACLSNSEGNCESWVH